MWHSCKKERNPRDWQSNQSQTHKKKKIENVIIQFFFSLFCSSFHSGMMAAMKIHISTSAKEALDAIGGYHTELRGT